MKINTLVWLFFLLSQSISPSGPTQSKLEEPVSPGSIPAPVLKWENGGCPGTYCQASWHSSPAVADLDNDGKTEVIGAVAPLYILKGLTGVISSTLGSSADRIWPDVVVADLNNDGFLEIVTANYSGRITVYTHDGKQLWFQRPTALELTSLAASDLDGDGNLEIIAASEGIREQWKVYRSDGSVYPQFWPELSSEADGNAAGCNNENIAAGDLNGDGRGEIIGPSDTNYIAAFNDDGTQILANSSIFGPNKYWSQVGIFVDQAADLGGDTSCTVENRPNFADSAPILADLLGNGTLQVVVVGNVNNCTTDLYQMPFIFNADRTRWKAGAYDWTVIPTPDSKAKPLTEDDKIIEHPVPNPVAADLDGDGRLEILYPSYDGRMHAYWLDKTEHGNWPYSVVQNTDGFISFASEPVVADLNKDGKNEVIFASWTQKGWNQTGKLYILDYLGNPLQIVSLPEGNKVTWNGALAAPTLADIDGDNELEIVLNTVNSGFVAYDLPGVGTNGIAWGTGRGSYQRNGLVMGSLTNSQALVAPAIPAPGGTLAYTIKMRNPGLLLSNVTLTDTLSTGQTYANGLTASSGTAKEKDGAVYWTGNISTLPVTITFNTTVDSGTDTRVLTSTVLINDARGSLIKLTTTSIVNGFYVYLPKLSR
jgi:uncharacterized repeat protein (TIGR01451 family)